jgi:hypothetical protein
VVAAGFVLGGAVAVSNTGHDTPLDPVPGGLLDRPTRDAGGGLPAAPGVPVDTDAPWGPARNGERPAPAAGVPPPHPAGTGQSPVLVAVPRAPAVAPGAPAATDPPAAAGGGTADPDRSAPAPAARSAGGEQGTTGAAADPVTPPPATSETPAGSGAGVGTAGADGSGAPAGPVGGLLGGATDAVGGLLGG